MKKAVTILVILLMLALALHVVFSMDMLDYFKGDTRSESLEIPHETKSIASEPVRTEKADFDSGTITLGFAGDVLLSGNVEAAIEKKGENYLFSGVAKSLHEFDFMMANLENPLTERGSQEQDKQYTFRAKPQHAGLLWNAGIDCVSLGNNHILDYGTEGLLDTIRHLNEHQIDFAGAGANAAEAYRPVFREIKGVNIAVLAASRVIPNTGWAAGKDKPGVAVAYNPERVQQEIAGAKKEADLVFVYVHWGEENKELPAQHQLSLAKSFIDSGADAVIGAHPHVMQGFEFYKGKLIAYSLGNFVFTNIQRETLLLKLKADKNGIREMQAIPCEIRHYRPEILSDGEKSAQILRKLEVVSTNVNIDEKGMIHETSIRLKN